MTRWGICILHIFHVRKRSKLVGIPRKFTPKAGFILINVFLLYRTLISIFDSNVSGMLPEGDFYCDFYLIFLPCHLYSSSMFFHDSLTNIKPQPAASPFPQQKYFPCRKVQRPFAAPHYPGLPPHFLPPLLRNMPSYKKLPWVS